jgi:hypothetical protein
LRPWLSGRAEPALNDDPTLELPQMKPLAIALLVALFAQPLQNACAQTLNARRMGMGGVVLPGGSESFNPAYRAVAAAPEASTGVALPIGLLPWLTDPPVLDPDDPAFNIYELANQVYNPPWNLQLVAPEPPSSDVVVELGRNHLAVDLGEIGGIFPHRNSSIGAVVRGPTIGFGVRNFFAGATAVVHYENDLGMNPALFAALAQGHPFQSNTRYVLNDNAKGQAAAALELGWAGSLFRHGDLRRREGHAFYGGIRARVLRGLAYGASTNQVAFRTRDTLFSSSPVELDYGGTLRTAGPEGGGFGQAFDLGGVWIGGPFEVGLGISDLGSRIDWRVEESAVMRDTVVGDIGRIITGTDVPLESTLPRTIVSNFVYRTPHGLLAADVVRSLGRLSAHLGAETWIDRFALRAGLSRDADATLQFGGGTGVRIGRFGLDVAVATHSRNLSRERGVELGAGLALYP